MDAQAVRKSLESRRRAALTNAREGLSDVVRNEGSAQAHALTLVLRDLGLEDEAGRETRPPRVSPTVEYVLRFAGQMEAMLDVNRDKGDRDGWLSAWPLDLANAAQGNLRELTALLTAADPTDNSGYDHASIARRAANVANFCMMVVDRCGALVLPGESLDVPSMKLRDAPRSGDPSVEGHVLATRSGEPLLSFDPSENDE
jgi:hypothetical protein